MATVLLAALSLLAPLAAVGAGPKRNVLYIVFDDLRPDLSMYTRGAPTVHTPHLQRLAAGGLV
jgi:arylsulfatase A-like enzyme